MVHQILPGTRILPDLSVGRTTARSCITASIRITARTGPLRMAMATTM